MSGPLVLEGLDPASRAAAAALALCVPGQRLQFTAGSYRLDVLDQHVGKAHRGSSGALLIPRGREHEYSFADPAGQQQLLGSTTFNRLVFVTIPRTLGADSKSADAIQAELSAVLKRFQLDPDLPMPYLAVSESLGAREVLHDEDGILVEDVKLNEKDKYWLRRLIFQSRPGLIQTELKLTDAKEPLVGESLCDYQAGFIASLLLQGRSSRAGCLIGLGGGGFSLFVSKYLPEIQLEVVELEDSVYRIASKFFGLTGLSDKVKVVIEDGLEFVSEKAREEERKNELDFLIVDVDDKDSSKALSCPPPAFLTQEFLSNCASILSPSGLLILNLACRDSSMTEEFVEGIKKQFAWVDVVKMEDEINSIVTASQLKPKVQDFASMIPDGLSADLREQVCELFPKLEVPKSKKKRSKGKGKKRH